MKRVQVLSARDECATFHTVIRASRTDELYVVVNRSRALHAVGIVQVRTM